MTNATGPKGLKPPTEDDAAVTDFEEILAADLADPAYRELHETAQRDLEADVECHNATLAQLRRAQNLTQVQLAKVLGSSQAEISRIEHQADLYLSTLRSYVEAAGGEITVIARIADGSEFELKLGALTA